MTDFYKVVLFTIRHETGGDPEGAPHVDSADPGGATKWGISQRYHPDVDVLSLTYDQAVAIYKSEYWDRNGCEGLPYPMNCLHFDTCVNPGASHAAQFRSVAKDSRDYLLRRESWYVTEVATHPEKKRYRDGWLVRCVDFYKAFMV